MIRHENTQIGYYERVAEEVAEQAFRAANTHLCPECGSVEGVIAISLEFLRHFEQIERRADYTYHRLPGDNTEVFCPCWMCRPSNVMPEGYVAVGKYDQAVKWLEANNA